MGDSMYALYDDMDGWNFAEIAISEDLVQARKNIVEIIAGNESTPGLKKLVDQEVDRIWKNTCVKYSRYGATDSECRAVIGQELCTWVHKKFGVKFRYGRFGFC